MATAVPIRPVPPTTSTDGARAAASAVHRVHKKAGSLGMASVARLTFKVLPSCRASVTLSLANRRSSKPSAGHSGPQQPLGTVLLQLLKRAAVRRLPAPPSTLLRRSSIRACSRRR